MNESLLIKKVKLSIDNQIKDLPRKKIANRSLKENGILIYASSDKKIVSIINFSFLISYYYLLNKFHHRIFFVQF